jgi:hypothetical protein
MACQLVGEKLNRMYCMSDVEGQNHAIILRPNCLGILRKFMSG